METQFRYIRDPVFVVSVSLYLITKFIILENGIFKPGFIASYFNDFLLVPVVLPILLFFCKKLNLRLVDIPPTFLELIIPLLIWSALFEFIFPYFIPKGTADLLDILFYFLGGFLSWMIWNKSHLIFVYKKKKLTKEGMPKNAT